MNRIANLKWIFIVAIVQFGCGKGGDKVKPGTPKSDLASVRFAYFPNVTHAPAIIAIADGSVQKAVGTSKVDVQVFSAGPAEMEALLADQVDIGVVGPGPAINAFSKSHGTALQIVQGCASGGSALVARKGINIKTVADLANKRVADPQVGGTQDLSL